MTEAKAPSPPAYDASLADHGFEAREHKGLTYPLGRRVPEPGEVFPLQPGIGWARMPVPGSLNHINVWLLDDRDEAGEGVAIVDTGLRGKDTREAWQGLLEGRRVTRVICTHFHPDHIGSAGWLCENYSVRLWMNRTEWLMARMLVADVRDAPPEDALAYYRAAGWDEDRIAAQKDRGWGFFSKAVSPLPLGFHRISDGNVIETGARRWTAMTGGGHTPEHTSFIDFDGRVMISGDQILPRITSNVSLSVTEPDGDPLGEWIEGLQKFREALPADMLVLPAHGEPFTGVHARLDKLMEGHSTQLDRLAEALANNDMRAVDSFSLLFARTIDDSVYGLATGEAMAHLRHLEATGRARCDVRDGEWWFSA